MFIFKKMYLKQCLQPGARGLAARKDLEKGWRAFQVLRFIPFCGWLYKLVAPTLEEVEEAMEKQRRGIKL